jgi:hypothetical protein
VGRIGNNGVVGETHHNRCSKIGPKLDSIVYQIMIIALNPPHQQILKHTDNQV